MKWKSRAGDLGPQERKSLEIWDYFFFFGYLRPLPFGVRFRAGHLSLAAYELGQWNV